MEPEREASPPVHVPVMVEEVLRFLPPRPDATVVDATVGLGGHSAALLERWPDGRLIALDCDPDSLALAQLRLQPWAARVTFLHANFQMLATHLASLGVSRVDGVLLDLGLSSWQLLQPERGLSFQLEGPLDMRLDPTRAMPTAAELLRRLSLAELTDLFRCHGEERYAARIARAIVTTRRQQPLRTTRGLATLVERAVPRHAQHQRLHPATRVFQALRIAVNHEVEALERALQLVPQLLAPAGRLVVLSFQSLEDRVVKRAMQQWARAGLMTLLTPKPLTPSPTEQERNPRARSAKLRACQRLSPPTVVGAQTGRRHP